MKNTLIEDVLDIAETQGRAAAVRHYRDTLADQADAEREGRIDSERALEEDATGQDCEDRASLMGCGADDSYDKSGARRRSQYNDAGEMMWS